MSLRNSAGTFIPNIYSTEDSILPVNIFPEVVDRLRRHPVYVFGQKKVESQIIWD